MDRLLTVDQAGELWNNGPRFVRRLIAERRIELVAHGSACANRRKCIDQVCGGGLVAAMPIPTPGRHP